MQKGYCADCDSTQEFDNQGRCIKCTSSSTMVPNTQALERMLRNLLAVVHRDGGYKTEELGLEEATNKAMKRVAKLNMLDDAIHGR